MAAHGQGLAPKAKPNHHPTEKKKSSSLPRSLCHEFCFGRAAGRTRRPNEADAKGTRAGSGLVQPTRLAHSSLNLSRGGETATAHGPRMEGWGGDGVMGLLVNYSAW